LQACDWIHSYLSTASDLHGNAPFMRYVDDNIVLVALPPEVRSAPLPPSLMAIVWGYVWPNWWQSGQQEELLDFIEDNTMPDLIEEGLLLS
jgi:hypothetical protein